MKALEVLVCCVICFSLYSSCDNHGTSTEVVPQNKSDNYSNTPQSVNAPRQSQSECQNEKSGKAHSQRAFGLAGEGRYEEAVKEFQCAIEKGYDSIDLREEYAVTLQMLKRHEEVIEQSQIIIQREEDNWRAHTIMLHSLIEIKKYEKALKELTTCGTLDSSYKTTGTYFYQRAIILDGLKRFEEALIAYEQYLDWARKFEPHSQRTQDASARAEALKQMLEPKEKSK